MKSLTAKQGAVAVASLGLRARRDDEQHLMTGERESSHAGWTDDAHRRAVRHD
jgi:hypothetical protein